MRDSSASKARGRETSQRATSAPAPGKATRVERRYGASRNTAAPVQAKAAGDGQAPSAGDRGPAPGVDPLAEATPAQGLGVELAPSVEAGPPAAPLTASQARDRFQRQEGRRTEIEAQITQEDAMREGGATKTHTTRAQLTDELAAAATSCAAARTALDAGTGYEGPLAAFEAAVQTLHGAYLASAMESTDAPAAAFAVSADLDVLGSNTAHAKILQWQAASRERYNGAIKFAVPPLATTGGVLVCRVGNAMAVGHNQVAGGDAIAAGFIQVSATGHTVTAFENTSGGYRPGSLRNATAQTAIEAAQPVRYTVVQGARRDNTTGSYDTSTIDRPGAQLPD